MNNKTLGLITGGRCNLNCNYCFLHKNPSYTEEDKLIEKAISDGSFIYNVKSTLNHFSISRLDFTRLEFWGAEPSLHFSEFENFLNNIFTDFPNISEIVFSTNFLTNLNNYIKLVEFIELYAKQQINLQFQISVDGPDEINKTTRGHLYSEIKEQLINFITYFNYKKLNKCHIHLYYKATWPLSVFHNICSDDDNLKSYSLFLQKENEDIQKLNFNSNINFDTNTALSPSLVVPDNFTQLDGFKFANYADRICRQSFRRHGFKFNIPINAFNLLSIEDDDMPLLQGGCGQLQTYLLFNWNGTLGGCSNGFLNANHNNLQWLKENDPLEYAESLNTFHLLDHTDNNNNIDYTKIQSVFSYIDTMWKYQKSFCLSIICSEMKQLADCGLIAPIYSKNQDILFKHASQLARITPSCYFSNFKQTNNPYVPNTNLIKLCCNGLYEVKDYWKGLNL